MNCETAFDLLLEADPADLEVSGEGDLSAHLAICDRCRALADQILEGNANLASDLESSSPISAAEPALEAMYREIDVVKRRKTMLAVGAPVAIAAGVAAIVLAGNTEVERQFSGDALFADRLPGLEVQSPPGTDVAVFEVADRPDVVVVWFFDSGED